MPEPLKLILISLIKTLTISASAAVVIDYFIKSGFLPTFVALTCIQFIISYTWSSLTEFAIKNRMIQEETKRIELYSMQGTDVQCAYCKSVNFIPVRFDEDNEFECESCGKKNSVYVDVTTTQKTNIPQSSNMSIDPIINKTLSESSEERI